MYIACAFNKKYLPHAATMLCSLLRNNTDVSGIYALHDKSVKTRHIRLLKNFVEKYRVEINFYNVDNNIFDTFPIVSSYIIYYRIMLPEYLPQKIDKILYLDSDIIVRKSLTSLWNINIEKYALAAVQDLGDVGNYFLRLNIPQNKKYFNSGVLLINLTKWRKENLHIKVLDWIKKNTDKLLYPDQDALNATLFNDWLELPLSYNVYEPLFLNPNYKIRYAEIVEDPYIVHFTGKIKPWMYLSKNPFKNEYIKYRQITPFKYRFPENFNFSIYVKYIVKKYIRKLSSKDYIFSNKISRKILLIFYIILQEREVKMLNSEKKRKEREIVIKLKNLIPDFKVINGPFKEMKYSELKSICSALAPKLLGTYESELHDLIEEICKKKYSTIINIGCAEGYYAIGFAMRIPEARIYAFDIDDEARKLCYKNALINNVSDRIIISKYFSLEKIDEIKLNGDGLIFSDCEGAERYIFYKETKNWGILVNKFDLLIEVHEKDVPGTTKYLIDLFSEAYIIKKILSVDDELKPYIFNCKALEIMEEKEKIELMSEGRGYQILWLFLKRKGYNKG
ncbi:MAG: 50S ribosomal protein L11 methyltransferase [Candidatus Omnitrophica bacterium]|nr:50S ribosomal protein L11 methyltransferase [Candidatus Omnitrophota bacterium]